MKVPVRRREEEAGQAALLVVLAIGVFLLGAVGLAVDASNLYAQRQMAQAAADAGAQAGLLSFFHGTYTTSTLTTPHTCTTSDTAAPCSYVAANGFKNSANPNDTVNVTYGSANSAGKPSGITLPGNPPVSVSWMTVKITRNVPTTLIRLVGAGNTSTISATATAAFSSSSLNCITTLGSSGTGLSIVGNATLNLTTCGIQVDSSSTGCATPAMSANGNVHVQAGSIQVVGGYCQSGNVTVTCTGSGACPATSVPAQADPLGDVWAPSPGTCNYTNLSITSNKSLSQGTYCGGISVSGNANVTFSSGTYILLGGGFKVSGNTSLTGSGVTFYNTFDSTHAYGNVSMNGNGAVSLSAPGNGSLQGMLFFEDRNAPAGYTDSFTGNSNQTLTGMLYFPRDSLSYVGNSGTTAQDLSIVAQSVSFTGNTSLTVNPALQASGGPVSYKVSLVQ